MNEALLNMSFTLAAFIFNVTLCVLVTVNGTDKDEKNHTFRNFTYILLIGNAVTICDVFYRRSAVVWIPYIARLVIYVLSFLSNVMLTYFFAIYAERFFFSLFRSHITSSKACGSSFKISK